ncbi:MAG: hypothetical protein ACLQMH_14600 [Solirubrobacteraceae bacterium]
MLPAHFPAGGPRLFDLSQEWPALKQRYACLGPSATLDWIYQHVDRQGATEALLEHEYIDGDYRDEYANFYIKVFRNLPDRGERLHFWARERYLGYCSIRPVYGQPVCRTMLDPGSELEDAVSCVVDARAHPYGHELHVPAFPFISQDRQYGRCAHAVLWMISHYHHLLHDTPARTMSDIVKAAAEHELERTVPSRGMTEEQVGATLRRIDLAAVKYRVRDENGDARLDRTEVTALVRRYLNSRLPLVLATPGHLTAIIGGSLRGNALQVVRCDDERGAYCPQGIDLDAASKERWMVIFVPLPGRIYLLGEDVDRPARQSLAELMGHPEFDRPVLSGRTLRFREYVVDSRRYKEGLQQRGLPAETVQAHLQVPCPRWIWVLEVQDANIARQGVPCTLGEIAIDATSDGDYPQFLLANLPGLRASWRAHDVDPTVLPDSSAFAPYMSGTALTL